MKERFCMLFRVFAFVTLTHSTYLRYKKAKPFKYYLQCWNAETLNQEESLKLDINFQSLPQRVHSASPLERPWPRLFRNVVVI
jgi:hypothetical protein